MTFIEALKKAKEISKERITDYTYVSSLVGLTVDGEDTLIEVDEMGNVYDSGGIMCVIEDFEKDTWDIVKN